MTRQLPTKPFKGGQQEAREQLNSMRELVLKLVRDHINVAGDLQMDSGPNGVTIWSKGRRTHLRGKLSETLSQGSLEEVESASMVVWRAKASAESGDDWKATDHEITVYDNGMMPDDSLPEDTFIQVVLLGGKWYYDGHNCNADS